MKIFISFEVYIGIYSAMVAILWHLERNHDTVLKHQMNYSFFFEISASFF